MADRELEREYPHRLAEDLEQDLVEVERVSAHADMREAAARAGLTYLESAPGAIPIHHVVDNFNRAGFITFCTRARSTRDDLEGTGNLSLIRDSELRQAPSRYYRSNGRLQFLEKYDQSKIDQVWHTYRTELDRHLSPLLVLDYTRADDVTQLDYGAVEIEKLKSSRELKLQLEKIIAISALEKRMLGSLDEEARAMLEKLRAATG